MAGWARAVWWGLPRLPDGRGWLGGGATPPGPRLVVAYEASRQPDAEALLAEAAAAGGGVVATAAGPCCRVALLRDGSALFGVPRADTPKLRIVLPHLCGAGARVLLLPGAADAGWASRAAAVVPGGATVVCPGRRG